MRKFRFVGSEEQAEDYIGAKPEIGKVYDEDDRFGGERISYWVKDEAISNEWKEVFEEDNTPMSKAIVNLIRAAVDCKELDSEQKLNIIKEITKYL